MSVSDVLDLNAPTWIEKVLSSANAVFDDLIAKRDSVHDDLESVAAWFVCLCGSMIVSMASIAERVADTVVSKRDAIHGRRVARRKRVKCLHELCPMRRGAKYFWLDRDSSQRCLEQGDCTQCC